MSLRSDLKDHLQTAFGDGYAVYEAGEDLVKTPCVIINPSTGTYLVPTTMGEDARIQTFLNIWVCTNRTSPGDALNHLEAMRKTASQAVKTFTPRGRWTTFGSLGTTSIGGQDSATGVLETLFVSEDTETGV